MIECTIKIVLFNQKRSQSWLADELGVSRQYISRVVNDKQSFSRDRLNDFCRVLQCQPGDLLRYVPDDNQQKTAP